LLSESTLKTRQLHQAWTTLVGHTGNCSLPKSDGRRTTRGKRLC